MTTNDSQSTSKSIEADRGRRSRRRWWWGGGITIAIVVLGLAVFIGPRHATRYFVAQELDRMGILHEGVGTIDIDLWEQEASFGPVRFRMAANDPGQIARFGLKLRLWNLLSQRALVEFIIVEGVDIRVKRLADGTLTLNGVSLGGAVPGAAAPEPLTKENEGGGWQAALENLQLRDSRLVFTKENGGEAVIEVDRLTLAGFSTWAPNDPGKFDLTGRVNNIALRIKGEAKPFAKQVSVTLDATLSNTEVAKIERYTGPLGFERRAGVLGGKIAAQTALYPDGRIDATAKGQIEISGVDMARANVALLTARSTLVDFDTKVVVGADRRQTVSGSAAAMVGGVRLELDGDTSVGAENVVVSFTNLTATRAAEGQIDLEFRPAVTVTGLQMTAPQQISLGLVEFPPSKVTVSGQPGKMEIMTAGNMKASNLTANLGAKGSASLAAAATTINVDAKLGIGTEARTISGIIGVKVEGLRAQVEGDVSVAVENVALSLADLAATLGPNSAIEAGTRPSLTVAGLKVTGPQELSLDSVEGALSTLKLSGTTDEIALDAAGKVAVRNVNAKLETNRLLETTFGRIGINIRELTATLGNARSQEWATKLSLTAEAAKASLDGGKAASATVEKIAMNDIAANHENRVEIAEFIIIRLKADLTDTLAGGSDDQTAAKVVSSVKGAPPAEPQDAKQPAPEPKAEIAAIKIGRITLADGARIAFKDGSVTPPIDAKIAIETLEIKNVDTVAPSARSDVRINAKVNDFSGIDVAGWVAPFGGKPDLDLKTKITGLELPRFSGYAAKVVGVHVESGQLNLNADTKAVNAVLDATVKLNVKDLKFEALSPEEEKKLSVAVGMPVQTAVGLLQDSDNAINLTIPVRGTVSAPEYDLGDAIGQAVGGALKSIFPPTALASMLISTGKSSIEFKPIPFVSGSELLGPKARGYADSLALLLTERPKLSVRVCGKATADDLAGFAAREAAKHKSARKPESASQSNQPKQPDAEKRSTSSPPLTGQALISAAEPELSKLALARTNAIRSHLLKESEVLGKQLSECRSKFDPNDQGPPRVDVSL